MSETTSVGNWNEFKLFRIIFLTMMVFGIYNTILSGKFIVPLPAFEIVVCSVSMFLAYRMRKTDVLSSLLFILFGITHFLSRSYNFTFFMSDEALQAFSETWWIDVFYILSALFLSFLLLRQVSRANWHLALRSILPLTLIFTLLDTPSWLALLPLIAICVLHLRKKTLFIDGHCIWAYLLLFAVSRELTLKLLS